MAEYLHLHHPHRPDWQGLIDNATRKGTPERVYHTELYHDKEIVDAIVQRFNLEARIDRNDNFDRWRYLAFQRFCGLDYVRVRPHGFDIQPHRQFAEDTAALRRDGGRNFQDQHTGPIMNWEDFEIFSWPDPKSPEATIDLEWWQVHLPEDMCIVTRGIGHFAEWLTWLMGYETLCMALYEQRDLVKAIADKIRELNRISLERVLEFDRVKIVWVSDDMGFKTGPLFSPTDMREFVLAAHREMAEIAHREGRLYWLHSCGDLSLLMDDLIHDVEIDGKHSFEDTIEDVCEAKKTYGKKIALLGGIDMDFLCRSNSSDVRRRVRHTLEACLPGGGYCLGTGNSVANYIPLDNYLAMLDEGLAYSR